MAIDKTLSAAQILRKARDIMNHNGSHWTKSRLKRGKGKDSMFCSIGGLNAAVGRAQDHLRCTANPEFDVAKLALASEICGQEVSNAYDADSIIMRWNDRESTSWEDVKGTFTAAARKVSKR